MLTIKHIDSNGKEYVRTCDSVMWVPDNGDAESFGSAGLYLDPEDETGQTRSHAIPCCRMRSADDRAIPQVFVMNKHGATIANYKL